MLMIYHLERIDGQPLPLVLVYHGPLSKIHHLGVAIGIYFHHVSREKKTSYFPLYWLFNRDPSNGLLQSSHICPKKSRATESKQWLALRAARTKSKDVLICGSLRLGSYGEDFRLRAGGGTAMSNGTYSNYTGSINELFYIPLSRLYTSRVNRL